MEKTVGLIIRSLNIPFKTGLDHLGSCPYAYPIQNIHFFIQNKIENKTLWPKHMELLGQNKKKSFVSRSTCAFTFFCHKLLHLQFLFELFQKSKSNCLFWGKISQNVWEIWNYFTEFFVLVWITINPMHLSIEIYQNDLRIWNIGK